MAEVRIDCAMNGIRGLKLVQYNAVGLPNTGTLLFTFENQPTVDTYSSDGDSSYFPLLFDNVNQHVVLSNGLPVMGRSHIFNGSHRLKIRVKRQDGSPVQYTNLDLIFIGQSHFEQSESYIMYQ